MEIVRQFPPFKFSGHRADFMTWKDKWEDFLQLLRQGTDEPLSSNMLLRFLEDKLDEAMGREITLKMKDPQATYDGVYLDICQRYGGVGGRQLWKSVRLQHTE